MIQAAGWWSAASSLLTELGQLILAYIPPTPSAWQAANLSGEEDEERLAADVGDERRCLPADQLFPNAAQLGRIRHRLSMAFNVVGHLAYPPSFGLLANIPVESCARTVVVRWGRVSTPDHRIRDCISTVWYRDSFPALMQRLQGRSHSRRSSDGCSGLYLCTHLLSDNVNKYR